jgi:hypothetical protein
MSWARRLQALVSPPRDEPAVRFPQTAVCHRARVSRGDQFWHATPSAGVTAFGIARLTPPARTSDPRAARIICREGRQLQQLAIELQA